MLFYFENGLRLYSHASSRCNVYHAPQPGLATVPANIGPLALNHTLDVTLVVQITKNITSHLEGKINVCINFIAIHLILVETADLRPQM